MAEGQKPTYEEAINALSLCQKSLAMLVNHVGDASSVGIISAYASCLSAETIARSVLSRAQAESGGKG